MRADDKLIDIFGGQWCRFIFDKGESDLRLGPCRKQGTGCSIQIIACGKGAGGLAGACRSGILQNMSGETAAFFKQQKRAELLARIQKLKSDLLG